MKILKKLFIFLPLVLMIILEIISAALENYGLALRQIPSSVLYFSLIASIVAAMGGCVYFLIKWCKKKKSTASKVTASLVSAFLAVCSLVLMFGSMFVWAFSYQPEHEVTKNGTKMIASVNSFLDVFVYYYEDKGPIFRGSKQIGEEWYGSGGYDPFATDMEVAPKRSTFS